MVAAGAAAGFSLLDDAAVLEDQDQIHFGRVHLRFHLASSLPGPASPEEGENTQIYGQM